MPIAEFEEKEYEVAADIELARNPDKFGPRLFSVLVRCWRRYSAMMQPQTRGPAIEFGLS
jgi:hypothetical protein